MTRCIEVNQKMVDDYNAYYLANHPRAKKPPIDRPLFPSLNKILSAPNRMFIANEKKKYGEFARWLVRAYKLNGLLLDEVNLAVFITFKDKTKRDIDNFQAFFLKVMQDALVEEKVIVGDDYTHIKSIISMGEYAKGIEKIRLVISWI